MSQTSPRRFVPCLIALVALPALAGCTPDVADREYEGLPAAANPSRENAAALSDTGTTAMIVGGEVLAITTWGSSSCHSTADSIDWETEPVQLVLGRVGGDVCTADMAAHTLEFDIPAGKIGVPIELEITYTEWDGLDRLTAE